MLFGDSTINILLANPILFNFKLKKQINALKKKEF